MCDNHRGLSENYALGTIVRLLDTGTRRDGDAGILRYKVQGTGRRAEQKTSNTLYLVP